MSYHNGMPVAEVKTSGGGGGGEGGGSGGGGDGGDGGGDGSDEEPNTEDDDDDDDDDDDANWADQMDEDDVVDDHPDHQTDNELYGLCGLDKRQIKKVWKWPSHIQAGFDQKSRVPARLLSLVRSRAPPLSLSICLSISLSLSGLEALRRTLSLDLTVL